MPDHAAAAARLLALEADASAPKTTAMQWQPIDTAPRVAGKEIIGAIYYNGKLNRDIFMSFWSPALGRFCLSPTHWIPLPDPPNDRAKEQA